jgi:YidC/Oxa1 family membrane protein insertase
MERRVLIAIFLSFLVLYTYQALFVRPVPKPATAPASETAAPAEPANSGSTAAAPPAPAPPDAASVVLGDSAERDIRIETPEVIAVFTNRGALLKSWRLKRYLDERSEPLELIANDLPGVPALPFTLRADDENVNRTLDAALFALRDAPPSGVVGATVSVADRQLQPSIAWGPALGDIDSGAGRYAVRARGLVSAADTVQRFAAADIEKQATHEGDFQYAGVDDHYFMTVVLNPGPSTVSYQHISLPPPAGSKQPARELMSYRITPGRQDTLAFYIGPKDFDQLATIDRPLVRAIDFGRFAFVVVPLLRALNWIYGYVGNYGWAIIILTVLINAAMFPLRHKSVVSMRKMQEIQPEAKAIQDRYAKYKSTDPAKQKMNQELMALYRERGVNPASGCIPMLLTFPVLFAFYALLTTAIELRGAPFVAWIHDLSMPDPYYVTPILMGISQIWQTRITPQAGADPAQQKMMMFMPVIFMFFFLWAPAGVAIYWLISNVWGIGQQYLTTYLIGPPNMRTPRPPAERRVRRVGASKTEAAARES